MMEVVREGGAYRVTVSEACQAPAEVVYDVLSDLGTHMQWGGSWQPGRTQRLQSMEAPEGPATVGVEFWSVGTANAGSWHDRSTVTAATRPGLFEFVTRGTLRDGEERDRMFLEAIHRYEIDKDRGGCRVSYFLSATLTVQAPPENQHPRLPAVIFGLMVPAVIERGTRNLVMMSEQRASVVDLTPSLSQPPRVAHRQAR